MFLYYIVKSGKVIAKIKGNVQKDFVTIQSCCDNMEL